MRQVQSFLIELADTPWWRGLERFIILITLISIFLYPPHYGPTRLENFFLPLMLISLLPKRLIADRNFLILIAINFIIGLISVLMNLVIENGIMELLRWFKYAVLLVFFSSLSVRENQFIRRSFFAMTIIMALINLIQIINPMNLGVEITRYYSHRPLMVFGETGQGEHFRLMGTTFNPNNNAILWLMLLLYFLVDYYYYRVKKDIFFTIISFFFIVFTQSRTAIATVLLVGVLNLFLYRFSLANYLMLLLSVSVGGILAVIFQFRYLWQMFLGNPLELHSLKLRFGIWRDLWEIFAEKPVFGWGNPMNYEILYAKVADNEFLYILLNQGTVGLTGVLLLFISIFHRFFRSMLTYQYSLLPVFTIICFLMIGLTNMTLFNIRSGMFLFMVCGIAIAQQQVLISGDDVKSLKGHGTA